MKRHVYQSLFVAGLILFITSCSSLHRGIPRGERHRRIEPKREQVVVQVPETEEIAYTETSESTASTTSEAAPTEDQNEITPTVNGTPAETDRVIVPEERIAGPVSGDTLEISQAELDEAMDSERVAKNAQVFSFLPLAGLFLLPFVLVGIIGTAILVTKLNNYQYVTAEALTRKKSAIVTVTVTSVIVVLLYVLLILFILAVL